MILSHMAVMLIRSLLATVTWSLATCGPNKREMNNMYVLSDSQMAPSLNNEIVYPSRSLDSLRIHKRDEFTQAEEISIEKQSPLAQQQQQQFNLGTRTLIKPMNEALNTPMTSSSSSHLHNEFTKRNNQSITQLTTNNLDISSTMFASDKNEYLPQISASAFSTILSSSASLLDSHNSTIDLAASAAYNPLLNFTALSLVATSNLTYNNEAGINSTDPFAFTTESRSMALPIEIQVSTVIYYGQF